jgi:hypothetical protein
MQKASFPQKEGGAKGSFPGGARGWGKQLSSARTASSRHSPAPEPVDTMCCPATRLPKLPIP